MVKEIIKNENLLKQKVENASINDTQIIQDLIDTANSLDKCIALPAVQIGYPKKIMVIKMMGKFVPMLNPIIITKGNKTKSTEKDYTYGTQEFERFNKVTVFYTDTKGKVKKQTFTDFFAFAVQHCIGYWKN